MRSQFSEETLKALNPKKTREKPLCYVVFNYLGPNIVTLSIVYRCFCRQPNFQVLGLGLKFNSRKLGGKEVQASYNGGNSLAQLIDCVFYSSIIRASTVFAPFS
jgi:hypothetical protein